MAQLNWGIGIGLHFTDNEEYYEILGYLARRPARVYVYTHKNDISGAWAGQGKLETAIPKCQLPSALKRAFDLSGDHRLSVSDYVANLVYNHAFTGFRDPTGNRYTYYRFPESIEDVRNTVPEEYLDAFNRGLRM